MIDSLAAPAAPAAIGRYADRVSRRTTRALVTLLAALGLVIAACGATPLPSTIGSAAPPDDSVDTHSTADDSPLPLPRESPAGPPRTSEPDQDLAGPWSPEPFQLGDPQVATVSDACAVVLSL